MRWWGLTVFMWIWGGFAVMTLLNLARTAWYGPLDVVYGVPPMIYGAMALLMALPAVGAYWLREKLEHSRSRET
jgi:hypothetical protein